MVRLRPKTRRTFTRPAFSLVELIIVVTIIGLIASIAVPRLSSAASSSRAHALEATLTNVRKAIDAYYAEHSRYPGYDPATGTPSHARFVDQLLLYTDERGNTNATLTPPYFFGPYLRAPFPRNPHNKLATVHVKATPTDANPAPGSVGWVAVLSHGYFGIEATEQELIDLGITDPDIQIRIRGLGFTSE